MYSKALLGMPPKQYQKMYLRSTEMNHLFKNPHVTTCLDHGSSLVNNFLLPQKLPG